MQSKIREPPRKEIKRAAACINGLKTSYIAIITVSGQMVPTAGLAGRKIPAHLK